MTNALLRSTYLAAALALGCSPETLQRVHYPEDPPMSLEQNQSIEPPQEPIQVSYIEQENGIRVPTTNWSRAETHYIVLNSSGLLEPHEMTRGRIVIDGLRYDCRLDLVDANQDGKFDLVRLTTDYTVLNYRPIALWGVRRHGQVILHDTDYDGMPNRFYRDVYFGRGHMGLDGIFDDVTEVANRQNDMDYYIRNWLIFMPQQNPHIYIPRRRQR